MPNYSATVKTSILKFFLALFQGTRSGCEDIWDLMYTFSNICRNLNALGVRNALQSIESSIPFSIFLYVPPCVIHCATRTTYQNTEKHFPCLIFGTRISDPLSKYGKASSITSEFGETLSCSVRNNYDYNCSGKQLALVCISQVLNQLIVTLIMSYLSHGRNQWDWSYQRKWHRDS